MRHLSPSVRNDAVMRALPRLYEASLDSATFDDYGGHLLLALTLIATTSANVEICRMARQMALERAAHWRARWPACRAGLNDDTVMQAVIAVFASERLGVPSDSIRDDVRRALERARTSDLLYFDPASEPVPGDIPYECDCGRASVRGARTCAGCGTGLEFQSRYEIWYYALTSAYFCDQCGFNLSVRFARILQGIAALRPYPAPGTQGSYHAIYAATHVVYTLNEYGRYLLPRDWLPAERSFLRGSVAWALSQGDADTLGEIVDGLSALGVPDDDSQLTAARRTLLDTQLPDGSWGRDGGDSYAHFHTLWAAIDGLRDHAWHGLATADADTQQALAFLAATAPDGPRSTQRGPG